MGPPCCCYTPGTAASRRTAPWQVQSASRETRGKRWVGRWGLDSAFEMGLESNFLGVASFREGWAAVRTRPTFPQPGSRFPRCPSLGVLPSPQGAGWGRGLKVALVVCLLRARDRVRLTCSYTTTTQRTQTLTLHVSMGIPRLGPTSSSARANEREHLVDQMDFCLQPAAHAL